MRIAAELTLIGGLIASSAYAVDGVLEINQPCAGGSGCFSGDTAGFPVQITTRGSYRLTSNLTPPNQNVNAISITTPGVSIDLNGFAIQGTNTTTGSSCSAPGTGSGVSSTSNDAVVSNGHIRGMGFNGVNFAGTNSRVERVIAEQNCVHGIFVHNASLVTDSVARKNAQNGIQASATVRISNCVADSNGASGILGTSGAVAVEGCVANQNGASGILLGSEFGSLVIGSTANNNAVDGISVSGRSLVLRSTTNQNGVNGIQASIDSGVGFVTANGNGTFNMFGSPLLVACVVLGNTQQCP